MSAEIFTQNGSGLLFADLVVIISDTVTLLNTATAGEGSNWLF